MNRYAKGANLERRARDYLIAQGYYCIRSAGSGGLFDLIALLGTYARLIQIKSNKWTSRKDEAAMLAIDAEYATIESWRYDDGDKAPKIRILRNHK